MEEVVETILRSMSTVNRPQMLFMITLLGALMIFQGKATFRNLSRYCGLHEKTFSRWFRRDFDFMEFNTRLLEHENLKDRDLIAAIDASFMSKSGRCTQGLGYFYNGSRQKAERGLELSNICAVDLKSNTAYSLDASQTIDSTDEQEARTVQYGEQILRVAPKLKQLGIKHIAADAAYSNYSIVGCVLEAGLHQVGRLRIDANLKWLYQGIQGKRGRPKKFDGKVVLARDLDERFEYEGRFEGEADLFSAQIWSVNLKRIIKVVVLRQMQSDKQANVILFSTDVNLDALTLVCYYKARFQIEFVFRDAKQFTGLTDCQACSKEAIHTQINASLTALNLMKLEDSRVQGSGARNVISIASWKRRKHNQSFMKIIFNKLGISPTCEKTRSVYQAFSDYGAIAA